MKRILSLITVLSLLLASSALPALAEEPVALVFWHSFTESNGALLEQLVADYNAAHTDVRVEAVYQGTYAEATQKLNSILLSGDLSGLPDVMMMDATGKVTYATSGAAYTVDDALADHPDADVSMMLEAAMGNWNYAGVQLGMPFATSTTVLYYNKTLLDAAGLTAPETLADIGAMAGRLPEGVTVFATVPNTPTLANWLGQLGSDVVDLRNGSEGSATALACVDNGALASFLTAWQELYATGALKNSAGSSDEFVAGTLAMMTSSSSSLSSYIARIGDSFELGVAAYPRVNADAQAGATVSGCCLVMFNTEKKEASWSFVQAMTGAEAQATLAVGSGYMPSNKESLETEAWQSMIAESPIRAVAYEQVLATPDTMRSVTVGPAADFYYAIQNCVSDMLEQGLSAEETVELMEDELGGLLEQYNLANP